MRKGLSAIIALSALGNVFAHTFAISRGGWLREVQMCLLAYDDPVKQELGKEGILPFSKFWACDWPAQAPTGEDYYSMLVDKIKSMT